MAKKTNIKSIDLAWILVNDLKKAVNFYTDIIGLKLLTLDEHYGWAELQGHEGGAKLGIAKSRKNQGMEPGQNACITLTVEDIQKAVAALKEKGAQCLGSIEEIPGHVKLQKVQDADGNQLQLVQKLGSIF